MSVHQDKNGTWFFTGKWKTPDGKWKTYKRRGFETKGKARKAEAAFDPQAEFLTSAKKSFSDLVSEYERIQSRHLKPSTVKTNVQNCRKHVCPFFGDMYIDQITKMDIENWKTLMLKKDLKTSSLNKIKSGFQAILMYAVKMDYIVKTPMAFVADFKDIIEDPDKIDEKDNFLETKEFKYFLTFVENKKDTDLYTFLFWTGCRISEALGLKWSDVDLEKKVVHLGWQLDRSDPRRRILPKTTNSIRTIDLFPQLVSMLKRMKLHDQNYRHFSDDFFVFGDIEPQHYHAVRLRLAKLRRSLPDGVKSISLHGFRHSHATFLIEQGIDDQLIAERLGMTVAVLRKTYAHVYADQRDRMLEALSKTFCQQEKELVEWADEKPHLMA